SPDSGARSASSGSVLAVAAARRRIGRDVHRLALRGAGWNPERGLLHLAVRVELGVPLPELHERRVRVRQGRSRDVGLVLPDRLVLLELLADLLHEGLAHARRGVLVAEVAHLEAEAHL